MIILDKIKNILDNKRFSVYEVNIPLESLSSGIQFEDYEKLERFMIEQNIKVMFFSKYYDNEENYIITKETLRKSIMYLEDNIIDVISNDINKYNKQISKIDFNKPCAVIVACIYEGQYCFVYMEDDKSFNKNILIEPSEKLEEIIMENINVIEKKQKENKDNIEKLKLELRELIINDKNFLLCKNKELRKKYITDLLKKKLGNHYKLLKNLWTTDAHIGVYRDAINFIEMIWTEIKNS